MNKKDIITAMIIFSILTAGVIAGKVAAHYFSPPQKEKSG